MALKDIWEDKIDGVSEVRAADINKIAEAVISLEKNPSSDNAFHYVQFDGVDLTPDSQKDTLNVVAGNNVSFTVNESADYVKINADEERFGDLRGEETSDLPMYVRLEGQINNVVTFEVVKTVIKSDTEEHVVLARDRFEVEVRTDERSGYYTYKEVVAKCTKKAKAYLDKVNNYVYISTDPEYQTNVEYGDFYLRAYPQFKSNLSFESTPELNDDIVEIEVERIPTAEYIDEVVGDIGAMLDELHNYAQSLVNGGGA